MNALAESRKTPRSGNVRLEWILVLAPLVLILFATPTLAADKLTDAKKAGDWFVLYSGEGAAASCKVATIAGGAVLSVDCFKDSGRPCVVLVLQAVASSDLASLVFTFENGDKVEASALLDFTRVEHQIIVKKDDVVAKLIGQFRQRKQVKVGWKSGPDSFVPFATFSLEGCNSALAAMEQVHPNIKKVAAYELGPRLRESSRRGNADEVRKLLDAGADVNGVDGVYRTALHEASGQGKAEVVRVLLDRGAKVDMTDIFTGATPLMDAAYGGHADVIRLLVKAGADTAKKNTLGNTPLHEASSEGHEDAVRTLVELGASISAKNSKGETPRDVAVMRKHSELVKYLDGSIVGKGAK